jgi:hypothetical protein
MKATSLDLPNASKHTLKNKRGKKFLNKQDLKKNTATSNQKATAKEVEDHKAMIATSSHAIKTIEDHSIATKDLTVLAAHHAAGTAAVAALTNLVVHPEMEVLMVHVTAFVAHHATRAVHAEKKGIANLINAETQMRRPG